LSSWPEDALWVEVTVLDVVDRLGAAGAGDATLGDPAEEEDAGPPLAGGAAVAGVAAGAGAALLAGAAAASRGRRI
jgi:hypothetical protein